MKTKLLKKFLVFVVITGMVFSNISFYVLSDLINSSVNSMGIVDKIWQLEQSHDAGIVDKFISIRNISEKLRILEAMAAAPTYVNKGVFNSGTSALTVAVPAGYADNDVFFLFVETANQAVTTPTGWTQVTNSPQSTGTAAAAGGVRLSVFYKVVTGAQSSVTVADSGDHQTAIIMDFRGLDTAAPVNISAGAVGAAATAMSFPTVTTTVADTFVILAAAMDTDVASTATVASWANANLTSITERHDQTVIAGAGGGLAIATGGKTTAGATGATTAAGSTSVTHAYMTIALKPAPAVTTISNFVIAEPGNSTIAPAGSAAVDSFGLVDNSGTDTVTAVTVGLAAGMGQYVQTVAITNSTGGTTYCSVAPSTDTASLIGCTIPVTTTNTEFDIKITADPHASMPAPPGGTYAVTATVTAWTGTNTTHAGSDSGSSTVTIDNASPNGATAVSGSAGIGANTLNWTTSNSADFDTVSGSIIYRWTSASAGSEVPVEGSSPSIGLTNGTATVACVVSSAASTALSKIDGTSGSAECTTAALTNGQAYTYKVFQQGINGNYDVGVAIGTFTPASPLTLTIAATAGSQVANLNSGDTSKFINNTACTSETDCAAFKMTASSGSVTITTIKVSEIGSVTANTDLSNPTLIYDTDANYSNGTTGTFGMVATFAADQTATFSNAGITIPSGSTYYFYIRFDMKSATPTYPAAGQAIDFQIANNTDVVTSGSPIKTGAPASLVGSTITKPTVVSYTNSTDATLNYTAACTNCGARIGPGSGYRQTIAISGYGFGADPGLNSRDTATNKVELVGAATDAIADDGTANTNVSAWSNTAITIRTDSSIAGNLDADWGTNFGGASALKVTAGGQANATNLNFYLFPQVTSLTVPTAIADAAREYNAADSDGVITLNGTRFGSASTGGFVRILGCDATTCSSPSGSANTTAWSNTAITAQVPAVITDNVYTGSVIVQQGAGSSNKQHTYTTTGFRILPRISSLNPTSATFNDPITVNGDHLCQNNGTCPGAFDANNKVVFATAVNATTFTSWSNTAIVTAVTINSIDGNVLVTSNTYNSNGKSFSVLSPVPNDPTALNQYKDAALSRSLTIGDTATNTPIYLTMTMSNDISGGTLYPQIENKPVGTAFSCSGASACAQAVEGVGKAGPGPVNCSLTANSCAIAVAPTDNVYHWQARVRHNKSGIDYYSAWVSFGVNGESATDYMIDTTAPAISFPGGGTCTDAVSSLLSNSAIINWNINESADGQVQYSKNSDLTGSTFYPATPDSMGFSHSLALVNLDSNTTYYFRVRSTDLAGNLSLKASSSPYCSFTTTNITQPAKTTKFYVTGLPGIVSSGTTATSSFSVYIPENSVSVKSTFIELSGISPAVGINNFQIQINSQATKTYILDSNESSFKLLYKIDPANLNLDPLTNVISITPSLNTNIASARIYVTYSFNP